MIPCYITPLTGVRFLAALAAVGVHQQDPETSPSITEPFDECRQRELFGWLFAQMNRPDSRQLIEIMQWRVPSLSTGDLVALRWGNVAAVWLCDHVGWTKLS